MSTTPPVVFVVDDDPAVRGFLSKLVESVGLGCESYASADDFIHHVDREQCGCAILDVRLPGSSGLDAGSSARHACFPGVYPAAVIASRTTSTASSFDLRLGAKPPSSPTAVE